MNKSQPILLDCTLRDGGYYNAWDFSPELIHDYLQAMAALATDYVEIGFRSFNGDGFKGSCAYSTDNFIRRLDVPSVLKVGVMVNAGEIINHPEGVVGALSLLFKPASESPLDFVRVACHAYQFEAALHACIWLKDKGYTVGINLMQVADLTLYEIENLARLANKCPPDVLYFADSMGSMEPDQVSGVVIALREGWDGPIGIHAHDNMGQALANSLRAVKGGVTWVDGTVTGMGRGPGNVKTEYLAIELADFRQSQLNMTPLLSLIAKYFKSMQAKYGWGANAYYYLAGKYGIHPSYVQEMLSDARYNDEDLIAVIEHLRHAGGKRFSPHALETGRHFYRGEPGGDWEPAGLISGREVLVVGGGPGATRHRQALEDYICLSRPVVIALNAQVTIQEELIDIRAASHPVRLMADYAEHLELPQPLAVPASMLPEHVRDLLKNKKILDFGMVIQEDTFVFGQRNCVMPNSLVVAYVLAIAVSGKARRVLLAGFDGYSADDPRTQEMHKLLNDFQGIEGVPPLIAITPSRYKVPVTSVYSLI